jgi:hypothetical protein
LVGSLTASVTLLDEQVNDLGYPDTPGLTVILQLEAYLRRAFKSKVPPELGTVVFVEVNEKTTGRALEPSATVGEPTTTTAATAIGATTDAANFRRNFEPNMDFLAYAIAGLRTPRSPTYEE